MAASKSRPSFWTSKEVSRLIARAMKHKDPSWQPTPGVPAWMDLREEIIKANSKGTYVVSPPLVPPRGYCIDQLPFEKDDGAGTYLRFRYYLGVVADLLSLARQQINQAHGKDTWQKASASFEEDAESRTLFRFLREVSAAPRPQAVHCLEAISKRGLLIEWTGSVPSAFWSRDCGVDALVNISKRIFDSLGEGGQSDTAENHAERKHVTVKSAGPNLVELRYQGKVVQLRGNQRVLFLHLFWHKDRVVPFKELWTLLYMKKTRKDYKPEKKGGPPACMRRTKADLDAALRGKFGRPKGSSYWIEPHQGCGYRLNVSSVDWQAAVGSIDYPLFTRDQRELEGNREND